MEKPSIYQNYFRKEDMGRPYENWGALLHDWFALWDVHLQVLLSTGGIYLELPLKQENATQIWECLKLNGGEKVISAELLTQIRKMEEHIENRVRNACSGEKIKTVSTNGHTRGKYQNRMYDVSKNEWCITTTKTHENNSSVSARIDHFLEVFSPSKLTIYALTAALSTEFCRSYERIYASLQDDIGLTQPSKGFVLAIYQLFESLNEEEKGDFLVGNARSEAFFRTRSAGTRYADQLYAEPYLLAYLLDRKDYPSFLPGIGSFFQKDEVLPQLRIRSRQVDALVELYTGYLQLERDMSYRKERERKLVISLEGHAGNGRHFLAKHFAQNIGKNLFFVRLSAAMSLESREWSCEKLHAYLALTDSLLCVEADFTEQEQDASNPLRKFWDTAQGACDFLLLLTDECGSGLGDLAENRLRFPIDYPDLAQKQVLWEMHKQYFHMEEANYAEELAGKYSFTVREIDDVVAAAHYAAFMSGRELIRQEDVSWAVQRGGKEGLKGLADLIRTRFTWDDLIMEASEKETLKLLCDRVRYRKRVGFDWGFFEKMPYGRGVSAVFYGAPGTGKTMAASVIANTLGMDLYQINLSSLLSKYIGETEKNIEDLFQRAKHMNSVLFFDEADTIFAKRTQVKDANDRSANSISGQLLKRFEEYEGIVILATNFIHNIDEAFKRRIQFLIPFTFPNAQTRLLLFQSLLPGATPCEEVIDCLYFASSYELSGSNIKEVLLTAAFLAAGCCRGIRNRDLAEAVRYCYRKYGKSLSGGECKYLETSIT